jgi:hypothetical protein
MRRSNSCSTTPTSATIVAASSAAVTSADHIWIV